MGNMKLLLACERSGVCRRSFRAKGHQAYSCDLEPADDGSPFHIQDDVLNVLSSNWDAVIAFPPCTYLSASGLHWNTRRPERAAQTEDAVRFFRVFTSLSCRWAIENPIGCMSRLYRKPDQIIQPYMFGDDASKATCLWLHGLPPLFPTRRIPGRIVNGRERWSNQTDHGQNKLPPSANRAMISSITYQGIADAMAAQWT
jgi:hypothetical protein